jgi:ubiquinone/menaquinone biosynthesis C-methylase UbiE
MDTSSVVDHYGRETPFDRICDELSKQVDLAEVTTGDLAGVDEFHLGGRAATLELLQSADLGPGMQVLDVGCGIGGVSRTIAAETGAFVTGVDLTPTFVETAGRLSALVDLDASTRFEVADATDLRFESGQFDAVTLVHVGMNIERKDILFAELARVLAPGGTLHVYDIMRVGEGTISYPVPWSTDASTSFVASPDSYVDAMAAAGLHCSAPISRLDLVQAVLPSARENPPAVNLSHLMGENWPTMITNLVACLGAGTLAPIEIVGRQMPLQT